MGYNIENVSRESLFPIGHLNATPIISLSEVEM